MARARNIKPGFFKNEDLGTADPFVSLLFAGLWTLADKAGILEDRPMRIKAELFPYRENFDINSYLTVLVSFQLIHRYEVDGLRLIQINNFLKHQNPHHTEKESEYPEYSDNCKLTVTPPLNNGITPSDSLIPDSLIPDSLIPDSARAGKKPPAHAVVFDPVTGTFSNLNGQMQIWQKAYPAVSIETEINKAAAWLVANPKNKKSNYSRFLSSWLSRAQDKARPQGNSATEYFDK